MGPTYIVTYSDAGKPSILKLPFVTVVCWPTVLPWQGIGTSYIIFIRRVGVVAAFLAGNAHTKLKVIGGS